MVFVVKNGATMIVFVDQKGELLCAWLKATNLPNLRNLLVLRKRMEPDQIEEAFKVQAYSLRSQRFQSHWLKTFIFIQARLSPQQQKPNCHGVDNVREKRRGAKAVSSVASSQIFGVHSLKKKRLPQATCERGAAMQATCEKGTAKCQHTTQSKNWRQCFWTKRKIAMKTANISISKYNSWQTTLCYQMMIRHWSLWDFMVNRMSWWFIQEGDNSFWFCIFWLCVRIRLFLWCLLESSEMLPATFRKA